MYASLKKSLTTQKRLDNLKSTTEVVQSFLFLRTVIGVIGLALPLALVVGKFLLEGPGIQPSISDYYYTMMRGVFVGSLWAIGVFLLAYRGLYIFDDIAGSLACLFALGVSLFPTPPASGATHNQINIGYVHFSCAAALFLILALFCLWIFPEPDPDEAPEDLSLFERRTYRFCGGAILACIVAIFLSFRFLDLAFVQHHHIVFWFESLAIWSFGFSWFAKGRKLRNLLSRFQMPPKRSLLSGTAKP